MKNTILSLTVLASAAAVAPAQTIAGHLSPNPVPPGTQVTFTATESMGQNRNLSSPCGWYTIHQGTQNGPVVPLGVFCIQVIVPVSPNGTFSFTWDQLDANGRQVPAGRYWVEVEVWDSSLTTTTTDWFCLEIQPATDPAVTQASTVKVGQPATFDISSPNDPGAVFFAAWSPTSNNPVSVIGLNTCLSSPISGDIFNPAIGSLDASGQAQTSINIPNSAALAYMGFHVQVALFHNGAFELTNDLSLTIQP